MVSRLQEKIDLGEFELGDVYKKGRIAQLGGVNPLKNNREWQGLVEFSNAFLAFVNLEKDQGRAGAGYHDYFDGAKFYWDSPNTCSRSSEDIRNITGNGKPVYLFCRATARKRSPHVYCGILDYEASTGDKPVHMRFHSRDYSPGVSDVLDELYEWRPGLSAQEEPLRPEKPSDNILLRLQNLDSTETKGTSNRRREQGLLRAHLFSNRTHAVCAICQEMVPVSLMHAAHIKRRAECTLAERTDLNVVMGLCAIGCDALFEKGYIVVLPHDGRVAVNKEKLTTEFNVDRIQNSIGHVCAAFSPSTKKYFKHRYESVCG